MVSACGCGSRNGRDWSAEFVAITAAVRALPFRRIMLDGEAVTHRLEGLPDFHKLTTPDGQSTACLYAFYLIWLEAQDLRGVELIGRRRMLHKALKKAGPALRFSEHMEGADGEAMFRHACGLDSKASCRNGRPAATGPAGARRGSR